MSRRIAAELRQENEGLASANFDLGNFVYTASHDLKSPVANIAGLIEELSYTVSRETLNRAEIKHKWLGRTLIHSNHRFSYEEVQQTIESRDGLHYKPILLLNNLAQQFRKERFANGAINFSSTEVKFQLDENGKPIGVVVKESKEAHQLIEEFMLLANEAVAGEFMRLNLPAIYRVHEEPGEQRLREFQEEVRSHA